jgi:hypothetical protein
MAKDPEQERTLGELRQEIAHSRDRLARDLSGLKYELDFGLKFRKSFQRHTTLWISAVVLTGVVMTARAASRKKKVIVDWRGKPVEEKKGEQQKKGMVMAGLMMGALKLVGTMVRPVIIGYVSSKLRNYGGGGAAGMPPPSRW